MNDAHQNYYEVLKVRRTASPSDIKQAFRRLAKKYHPDTNPGRAKAAAKRLKEVIAAYRVLSNERERARYDVLLQTSPSFGKRVEPGRGSAMTVRAKGILEDLLRGDSNGALKTYDDLASHNGFSLQAHLEVRNYLDCLFLLAEQMERIGRNRQAAEFYEELYAREKEPPRHRYFFDTVKARLKRLYSRKLPREARSASEEIAYYKRILEFDVDRSEKAFILKKIAEVYVREGQYERARKIFKKALDLKPGLKGTATIREHLGFE